MENLLSLSNLGRRCQIKQLNCKSKSNKENASSWIELVTFQFIGPSITSRTKQLFLTRARCYWNHFFRYNMYLLFTQFFSEFIWWSNVMWHCLHQRMSTPDPMIICRIRTRFLATITMNTRRNAWNGSS